MNDANVTHRPATPPQSGTYYLRRRIPTDVLVCYPGKKEITFSLRTKDYRTAVERHRAEEARLTVTLRQFWHSFALLLSLRFAGFLALFALLLSPVRKNLTLPYCYLFL
jgi:hypothetical protein